MVNLTKRHCKLFFKDKGMFLCALITPLILLVLYITFLGNVFKDSYTMSFPEGVNVPDSLLNGLAGGQLLSSLLSVCCVTVAFCSNMIMVQDKFNGARKDLLITPLKKQKLAISYYLATLISTLIICFVATAACYIYLAIVGWYMTFVDCLLVLFDVFLITMFGTVLSSIVSHFLTTQGQVSAVGTIVSSMYGFIAGAYMPIASFGAGLQKVLMFLPSTYCSALIRNHAMRGALAGLGDAGIPDSIIASIKDGIDCNLYFFGHSVSIGWMYAIIITTVVALMAIYVILNVIKIKPSKKIKKA